MSTTEPPPPSGSGSDTILTQKVDGCLTQAVGTQDLSPVSEVILSVIDSFKQKVAADRCVYIKKRMDENKLKLDNTCNQLLKLSQERRNNVVIGDDISSDLLTKRLNDAISTQNGIDLNNGDQDSNSSQEDSHSSSAILLGSSIVGTSVVHPIKLTEVKRLPAYTTWIFLDRNQRMTEDQSVVGRRRIYYDQNGGEALICSDSEEEKIEEEEDKKEFKESEDYVLRMTIKEIGSSYAVLDALARFFSRKPSEIKERYEVLAKGENSVEDSGYLLFDKDLEAALDSFDNLFCRRCYVFDCRLHGCSQDFVFPAEKQLSWNVPDEENAPCGPNCFKVVKVAKPEINTMSSPMSVDSEEKPSSANSGARLSKKQPVGPSRERRARSCQSESASSSLRNISESSESETRLVQNIPSTTQSSSSPKSKSAGKLGVHQRNRKRVTDRVLDSTPKRQKKTETSDSDTGAASLGSVDMKLRSNFLKGGQVSTPLQKTKSGRGRPRKIPLIVDSQGPTNEVITKKIVSGDGEFGPEECVGERFRKLEISDNEPWKTIEKSLYQKGLEIFGRNSCLIAKNLMNGMKTCSEVFRYINFSENRLPYQAGDGANILENYSNVDSNEVTGNEVRRRSRFLRRRNRVRRLKYTWKSAGYHSYRKRISDKKDQHCRQFNPCGCESTCGKECLCHVNGTC